jgi:hypothetical protein
LTAFRFASLGKSKPVAQGLDSWLEMGGAVGFSGLGLDTKGDLPFYEPSCEFFAAVAELGN